MSNLDALFLREYQLLTHPPKDVDRLAVAVKVASCIPVLGAACAIGQILESQRLRKIDPSLEPLADQMVMRAIACIFCLGVLNILYDFGRDAIPNNYAALVQKLGYDKLEEYLGFGRDYLNNPNISIGNDRVKKAYANLVNHHPGRTFDSNEVLKAFLLLSEKELTETLDMIHLITQSAYKEDDDISYLFSIPLQDLRVIWSDDKDLIKNGKLMRWLVQNKGGGEFLRKITESLTEQNSVRVIEKTLNTPNWRQLSAPDVASMLNQIQNEPNWEALLDIVFLAPKIPIPESTTTDNSSFMKHFYYMVLDSKTNRSALDGANPDQFKIGLLDYLNRYVQFTNQNPSIVKIRDRVASAEYKYQFNGATAIEGLKIGGTGGHAVLYDVQLEPEGTYSFTLYNSGEGCHIADLAEKNCVGVLQYRNISADTMEEFLPMLRSFHDEKIHFSNVRDFIHAQLGPISYVISTHRSQNQGSCVYKCFSQYLHNAMGDVEWRKFKVWLTKERIEEAADLNTFYLPVSREEYRSMLRESHEVFHKRKVKLLNRLVNKARDS